jgi:hypothetical protein
MNWISRTMHSRINHHPEICNRINSLLFSGPTPLPLAIIRPFQLHRWHVANWLQQPTVIEPIHPFQGGVFDQIPWNIADSHLSWRIGKHNQITRLTVFPWRDYLSDLTPYDVSVLQLISKIRSGFEPGNENAENCHTLHCHTLHSSGRYLRKKNDHFGVHQNTFHC